MIRATIITMTWGGGVKTRRGDIGNNCKNGGVCDETCCVSIDALKKARDGVQVCQVLCRIRRWGC